MLKCIPWLIPFMMMMTVITMMVLAILKYIPRLIPFMMMIVMMMVLTILAAAFIGIPWSIPFVMMMWLAHHYIQRK